MTSDNFIYWLQGYLQGRNPKMDVIRSRLDNMMDEREIIGRQVRGMSQQIPSPFSTQNDTVMRSSNGV